MSSQRWQKLANAEQYAAQYTFNVMQWTYYIIHESEVPCHYQSCQARIDRTVLREQEELSNFIEGVNPFVEFTEAQLSIILEEVRAPLYIAATLQDTGPIVL